MARTRISTTVDAGLLEQARHVLAPASDSVLIDEALRSLIACHRELEIDASYDAYEIHPLDEPDAWGDLATFRARAATS